MSAGMALEHLDGDHCPDCGQRLRLERLDQGALFIACGYGATRRTIVRHCRCGWSLDAVITETRPPVTIEPPREETP